MICPICGNKFQPIKRLGGQNRKICYDCVPDGLAKYDRHKQIRKVLKEKAAEEKLKRGCDRCGYNKYPQVLEWHHDGDNKSFNPADRLKDGSVKAWEDYQEEIAKCSLLCANCHREVHIEQGDF